jgi:hypothetical protein
MGDLSYGPSYLIWPATLHHVGGMKSNALLAWGPIHDNQVGMPHNVDDDADSLAVNLSHIIADFETLHDRPSTEAGSRAMFSAFRSRMLLRASRVSSLRRVRPTEPYLETNSHAPSYQLPGQTPTFGIAAGARSEIGMQNPPLSR